MLFIIFDEWIFDELLGLNGKKAQEEALDILTKLDRLGDSIVYVEGDPFALKKDFFYANSYKDFRVLGMKEFLHAHVFSDPARALVLKQKDIKALDPSFAGLVPPSDEYILKTYQKIKHKNPLIVTSDGKWNHKKLNKMKVPIQMRLDFAKMYLAK